MARKCFTADEIAQLAANPYTHKVTEHQIEFTAEFKKDFWAKRCSGVTIAEAFRECGYDPEILGRRRMKSVSEKLRAQYKAGEEPRSGRRPYGSSKNCEERTLKAEVDELRHRMEYMEQQIDFLKRITPVRTSKGSAGS